MCKGSCAAATTSVAMCAAAVADSAAYVIDDDARLPRELAEQLEVHRVTGDLMRHWIEQETAVLRRLPQGAKAQSVRPALPSEVREVALRCMGVLTNLAGLNAASRWFDCALLLDTVCLSEEMLMDNLPAACAAIVALLKKSDSAANSSTSLSMRLPGFSRAAMTAAECLKAMGYCTSTRVTSRDIMEQEHVILTALNWQIHCPSVRAWLSLFCQRLDVITRRTWTGVLDWITTSTHASAGILVMHYAAYAHTSPQRMASGLFCLFLVLGRLLPLECLRPAHVHPAIWEELFAESQCRGAPPACALPPTGTAGMLEAIPLVTGLRLTALQEDLRCVLVAMQSIARNFQKGSQAQTARAGAVSRTRI